MLRINNIKISTSIWYIISHILFFAVGTRQSCGVRFTLVTVKFHVATVLIFTSVRTHVRELCCQKTAEEMDDKFIDFSQCVQSFFLYMHNVPVIVATLHCIDKNLQSVQLIRHCLILNTSVSILDYTFLKLQKFLVLHLNSGSIYLVREDNTWICQQHDVRWNSVLSSV